MTELFQWQDYFEKYSINEIRVIQQKLQNEAESQQHKLRTLVGEQYHDLLKTSDAIIDMNQISLRQEELLASLCHSDEYISWAKQSNNAVKFSDPQLDPLSEEISALSTLKLSREVVSLTYRKLRIPGSHLVLARSLYLLKLLIGDEQPSSSSSIEPVALKALRDQALELSDKFNQSLELDLIQERNDQLLRTHSSDVFLAYAVFKEYTPELCVTEFLKGRYSHIEKVLQTESASSSSPSSIIVTALRLISSTVIIANKVMAKYQFHKLLLQQSSVYSLLDSPEFWQEPELNIPKFKSWVSSKVKKARTIPSKCLEGLSIDHRPSGPNRLLSDKLDKFMADTVTLLSERLQQFLEQINDLSVLVELYSKVLELTRDNKTLRRLKSSDSDQPFFLTRFKELWSSRFSEIASRDVARLLDSQKLIEHTFTGIVSNSKPESRDTAVDLCSISPGSLTSQLASIRVDNLQNIFSSLSDFSSGSVGVVKDVAHLYSQWIAIIEDLRFQIEEIKNLKGYVRVRYESDDFNIDLEDDDDLDQWKKDQESTIIALCDEFTTLVEHQLHAEYQHMLHIIEKLDKSVHDSAYGVTFLIRITLLLDSHVFILKSTDSELSSKTLLTDLYQKLARLIPLNLFQLDEIYSDTINTQLWQNLQADADRGEIKVPNGPSLALLSMLSLFIENLLEIAGYDNLVWGSDEGLELIRDKIGDYFLKEFELKAKKQREHVQETEQAKEPTIEQVDTKADTQQDDEQAQELETELTETEVDLQHDEAPDQDQEQYGSKHELEQAQDKSTPSVEIESKAIPETTSTKHSEDPSTITLQMAQDLSFVLALIGRSVPSNLLDNIDSSREAIEKAITESNKEWISRIRMLYIPLAK